MDISQTCVQFQRRGLIIPEVKFADDIERFVQADLASPPPPAGLLLAGDSDIRLWDPQAARALAPGQPVINRGFGGARTWETVLYFHQTVLPARPAAIVYCAGDNDISRLKDHAPDNIALAFSLFLELVEKLLPQCRRVLFLAVHLTPSAPHKAAAVDRANDLVRLVCRDSAVAEFADYLALLQDQQGRLRTDCFLHDQVHFTAPFYSQLSAFLRPRIARWLLTSP